MPRRFGFMTTLLALVACGGGDLGDPSAGAWECTVSLTLEPATFGDLSSPSGSGTGTGQGASRESALSAAYGQACAQLPISGATLQACRNGEDFTVEGGGTGNIRLFSAVSRRVSCSSGN